MKLVKIATFVYKLKKQIIYEFSQIELFSSCYFTYGFGL